MRIDMNQWIRMLNSAADLLLEDADALCKIDSHIGDGDHGNAIARIAEIIQELTAATGDTAPAAFFKQLSQEILQVQGAAGMLWGTMFSGMGEALEDADAGIADVFEGATAALRKITNAKVGDKTMMDALYPAAEAMKKAPNDSQALCKGAEAAHQGAAYTSRYVACYGRAKNLSERSLGIKDAGACSIALLVEGMNAGYNGK